MGSISKRSLIERIRRGKPTRDRLVENNLSEGIAFQIAATRDRRGWTQAQLAEKAGVANNLPRLEDPEYGKQTLTTLKKLASALDVALVVRFIPFSQYVDWLSGTPHKDDGLRPEALAVPSFEEENSEGVLEKQVSYWSCSVNPHPQFCAGGTDLVTANIPSKPVTVPAVNDGYQTPVFYDAPAREVS
ncbi:MAG: helix-turn-helix domain-containing protein [Acidobacteriaceae bacterium]